MNEWMDGFVVATHTDGISNLRDVVKIGRDARDE